MAAAKEKMEALQAFCSGNPDEQKSQDLNEIIRKGGGLQKYRQRIAGLLHSRDATVRGFAVVWLADLGDPAYVKDILVLLQSENLPDAGGFNKNWDRGQAAFALGILGGPEHARVLATFLHHKDRHVQAGAVSGLARLKAKEYLKEIATLLRDDDERVVCAAIGALAELDAKQYSGQVAALLQSNSVDVPEVAMTALVILDAKEQAPQVADLLKDRFKGGQAAKTLALLGAEKYTQNIAALLNAEESSTRRDALLAMGILHASRYAPEVAKHMQDKEDFVTDAAAWSIVMMNAGAYTTQASRILRAAQKENANPMGSGEGGIPWDRLRQLHEQFAKSLARLEAVSKAKSPPKELTVDLGKGVKLEMVLIPAGEFMMGSPDSHKDADAEEKPQHRVRITKPFYLGKYPVTQEQWEAVMGDNPSYFKGPKNPVELVSWEDCQQFLGKLNAKSAAGGGKFQLPSEAQWEYACRAGSKTRYCFGDDEKQLREYAWYQGNSDDKTHPVGEKKPNAWGLYDMHGNVWEWCQDWWKDGYYKESPVDDPTGPTEGSGRVFRGGSWHDQARDCQSARRYRHWPVTHGNHMGLRISLVPAEAAEPTAATPKQITNSIGMKLTLIPSGEFKMGSGESEEATAVFFKKNYGGDWLKAAYFMDEHPQHRVRIAGPSRAADQSIGADEGKLIAHLRRMSRRVKTDGPRGPVVALDFSSMPVTDADLACLTGLSQLQRLDLSGTAVTDAGLQSLGAIVQLRQLVLANTKISDAGLGHLRGLVHLRVLNLATTPVTDAGLGPLRGLRELVELNLSNTKVTDAGLENLRSLARLQELDLSDCKITDAGLEGLGGLSQLRTLRLARTAVSGPGLEYLIGHPREAFIASTVPFRVIARGYERWRRGFRF